MSRLSDWAGIASDESPAPAGARQIAEEAQNTESGAPAYQGSRLGQWAGLSGLGNMADAWYTGRNLRGTNNGYDENSGFYKDWAEKTAKFKGSTDDYFKQPDATGIRTSAHAGKDVPEEQQLGAVFRNGQYEGNIYDLMGDRNAANLLMLRATAGDKQQDLFSRSDFQADAAAANEKPGTVNKTLDDYVKELSSTRAREEADAIGAQKLQDETLKQGWAYGPASDVGIIASGAAGGAAAAAGFNAILASTGIGAVPAAIIETGAAIFGGFSAWLNRDQLQTSLARQKIVVQRGFQDEGIVTGTGELAKAAGSQVIQNLSPWSNALHGGWDAASGKGGDKVSEYEVDRMDGGPGHGAGFLLMDMAAMAADSIGTFGATAAFRAAQAGTRAESSRFVLDAGKAYRAGMTVSAAGSTVQAIRGVSFDYQSGEFDNTYLDEDGNFSPTTALKAYGLAASEYFQANLPFAQGKATLGPRGEGQTIFAGGYKHTLDEQGKVISQRPTLELLAPSTSVEASVFRARARYAANKPGADVQFADEFLAQSLAHHRSPNAREVILTTALAEGTEEVVQAYLEPSSHNQSASAEDMVRAFFGGVGMGAGAGYSIARGNQVSALRQDRKDYSKYMHVQIARAQGDQSKVQLQSYDEWSKQTDEQKAESYRANNAEEEVAALAGERYAQVWQDEFDAKQPDLKAISLAIESALEKGKLPNSSETRVMTMLPGRGLTGELGETTEGFSRDTLGLTLRDLGQSLAERADGLKRVAEKNIADDITLAKSAGEETVELDREQQRHLVAADLAGKLVASITELVRGQRNMDRAKFASEIDTLNDILVEYNEGTAQVGPVTVMIDGKPVEISDPSILRSGMRLAAAATIDRSPNDSAASFPILTPQVLLRESQQGLTGVYAVSRGVLAGINGDWDGDRLRWRGNEWIRESTFDFIRAGGALVGNEGKVAIDQSDAFDSIVRAAKLALSDASDPRNARAIQLVGDVQRKLKNLLTAAGAPATRIDKLAASVEKRIRAREPEGALTELLNAIAADKQVNPALLRYATAQGFNGYQRIAQIFESEVQEFHREVTTSDQNPDASVIFPDENPLAGTQKSRISSKSMHAGSNMFATAQALLLVPTPFRVFTSLKYNDQAHQDRVAARAKRGTGDAISQALYEMTQGAIGSATDNLDATSRIQGQVRTWLEDIAAGEQIFGLQIPGGVEGAVLVAQLRVNDLQTDLTKWEYNGDETTLLQLLLKMAVTAERQRAGNVIIPGGELDVKLLKLEKLTRVYTDKTKGKGANRNNRAEAFMEIFGGLSFSELLGSNTGTAFAQITLENLARNLQGRNAAGRNADIRSLERSHLYQRRQQTTDPAYRLTEALDTEKGQAVLTPYRVVVDAVVDYANHHDARQKAKHEEIQSLLYAGYNGLRQVLSNSLLARAKTFSEDSVDERARQIQAFFEQDTELARKAYAQLPEAVLRALTVMDANGRITHVNPVLYKAYAQSTEKKFEAVLKGAILYAQFSQLPYNDLVQEQVRASEQRTLNEKFKMIPDRSTRLLFQASLGEGGEALWKRLLDQILASEDLDATYEAIATDWDLLGDSAPLYAWADDAADYEATLAKDGWGQDTPSVTLRTAASEFTAAIEQRLNPKLNDGLLTREDNAAAIDELGRAFARMKDGDVKSIKDGSLQTVMYRFQAMVNSAIAYGTMPGGQSLFDALYSLAEPVGPGTADKAKAVAGVLNYGQWQALRNRLSTAANFDQTFENLTAVELEKVLFNPADLLRGPVKIQLPNGQQYRWEGPTYENVFKLLQDPQTYALAMRMIMPTVLDGGIGYRPNQQYLQGNDLSSELGVGTTRNATYLQQAIPAPGQQLSFDQSMQVLSRWVALVANTEGGSTTSLMSNISNLIIQRLEEESAVTDGTVNVDDRNRNIVRKAITDYVNTSILVQRAATAEDIFQTPEVDGEYTVRAAAKAIRQSLRARTAGRAAGWHPASGLSLEQYVDLVVRPLIDSDTIEAAKEQMQRLAAQLNDPSISVAEIAAEMEKTAGRIARSEYREEQLLHLLEGDTAQAVLEAYALQQPDETNPLYDHVVTDAMNRAAKTRIISALRTLPFSEDTEITPSMHTRISEMVLTDDDFARDLFSPEEWDILSSEVINFALFNFGQPIRQGMVAQLYKPGTDNADWKKYSDRSMFFLAEDILDTTSVESQMLQAILKDRGELIGVPDNAEQEIEKIGPAIDRLLGYDKGGVGYKHRSSSIMQMLMANARFRAAGVEVEASSNGRHPPSKLAAALAAKRTYVEPDETFLVDAQLPASSLFLPGDEPQLDFSATYTGLGNAPAGLKLMAAHLQGAFISKLYITTPTGSIKLFDPSTPDPAEYEASGPTIHPNVPEVLATKYDVLDLTLLTQVLAEIADDQDLDFSQLSIDVSLFHPDHRPQGPVHANSIFYDGVLGTNDSSDSAIGQMIFGRDGVNSRSMNGVFKAQKNGRVVNKYTDRIDWSQIDAIDAIGQVDAQTALHQKALLLVQSDIFADKAANEGALGIGSYRLALKMLKLAHGAEVEGEDGISRPVTIDELIRRQLDPATAPKAKFRGEGSAWVATKLGDPGVEGLLNARLTANARDINLARPYIAVDDTLYTENTFVDPKELTPADVFGSVQELRRVQHTVTASAMHRRMAAEQLRLLKDKARDFRERRNDLRFDRDGANQSARTEADRAYSGAQVGAKQTNDILQTSWEPAPNRDNLEAFIALANRVEESAGVIWRVKPFGQRVGNTEFSGTLTKDTSPNDALHGAFGDGALFDVDAFVDPISNTGEIDFPLVVKWIKDLANRGVLGMAFEGKLMSAALTNEIKPVLESLGYVRSSKAPNVYTLVDELAIGRTLADRTLSDRYLAGEEIDGHNMALIALVEDSILDEGGLEFNPADETLQRSATGTTTVKSDFLSGFGLVDNLLPEDPRRSAIRVALQRYADTPSLIADALSRASGKIVRADDRKVRRAQNEIQQVLKRANLTFEPGRGLKGQHLHKGSMVVLVHPSEPFIYLQQVGSHELDDAVVQEMMRDPNTSLSMNVILPPFRENPEVTVREGIVTGKLPARNGVLYTTNIDLQKFGAKLQMKLSAFKGIMRQYSDASVLLSAFGGRPVAGNRPISIEAGLRYAADKDVRHGVLSSAQIAISRLGLNTLPLLAETLFPGDPQGARKAGAFLRSAQSHMKNQWSHEEALEHLAVDDLLELALNEVRGLALGSNVPMPEILNDPQFDFADPGNRLLGITLAYMMTEGADVDRVLKINGVMRRGENEVSTRSYIPPLLWASALESSAPANAGLKAWFIDQLNIPFQEADASGRTSRIDDRFVITTTIPQRGKKERTVRWRMFMGDFVIADSNPAMESTTSSRQETDSFSTNALLQGTFGVEKFYDPARTEQIRRIFAKSGAVNPDYARIKLSDMFDTDALQELNDGTPIQRLPLRARRQIKSDMKKAAMYFVTNHKKFMDSGEVEWDEDQKVEYQKLVDKIITTYNLNPSDADLVDTWVRMQAGRPGGLTGDGEKAVMPGTLAVAVAQVINELGKAGYLPTAGGAVQQLPYDHLVALFRANKGGGRFQLRAIVDTERIVTDDEGGSYVRRSSTQTVKQTLRQNTLNKLKAEDGNWDAWVKVALGMVVLDESKTAFHPAFLPATDGMLQSYRNTGSGIFGHAISHSVFKQLNLIYPETDQLVHTLDAAAREVQGQDLAQLEGSLDDVFIEQFTTTEGIYNYKDFLPSDSAILKNVQAQIDSMRRNGYPEVVTGMRNMVTRGTSLQNSTSPPPPGKFMSWLALKVLINPAMWTAARVEYALQRTVNSLKDLALGSREELVAHLDRMKALENDLGKDTNFRSAINFEEYFQNELGGVGQRATKWAMRFNDPKFGLPKTYEARVYLRRALGYLVDHEDDYQWSIEFALNRLQTDRMWLEKNAPNAHFAGLREVARLRGLDDSLGSMMIGSGIDSLRGSNAGPVRIVGNGLGVMFQFRRFFFNSAYMLSGTKYYDTKLANLIHGRTKGVIGELQADLRGEPAPTDEQFDLREITETTDLLEQYIQSRMTLSMWFLAGALAGSTALGAEDDESRRRRVLMRAREFDRLMYDPNDMHSDFRLGTAKLISDIPWIGRKLTGLHEGDDEDLASIPWFVNMIVSPVSGLADYFNGGDFSDVVKGFTNAWGSLPWNGDFSLAAMAITGQAVIEASYSDNLQARMEAQNNGDDLKHAFVWYAENKILEIPLLTALYQARDGWDRDPSLKPLRDADRNIQGDQDGNALPSTTLEKYVGKDGVERTIMSGYERRTDADRELHALTEKRPILAYTLQLIGAVSDESPDYVRGDMPKKIQSVELQTPDPEKQKAFVMAAWKAMGGGQMTLDDAENLIRSRTAAATGTYLKDEQITQAMKQATIANKDLKELPFIEAKAILDGKRLGTIDLKDASLAGIFITIPQRQEIARQWAEEIMQNAVNMGFTNAQAEKLMWNLWNGVGGPMGQPGLKEILYSDEIPRDGTLKYEQLNTMYAPGPNGYPVAIGVQRATVWNALGIPIAPTMYKERRGERVVDKIGNVIDKVAGINTGLRGVVRVPENRPLTDADFLAALTEAGKATYTPNTFTPFTSGGGGGGGGYSRGSGGGYYGGNANFYEMRPLPGQRAGYGTSIPFINTSNPIIRRASIRRERISGDRGRLKQWQ